MIKVNCYSNFIRDKLRKIFPLSAFHLNGYGQTEVSVMSAGPAEYAGLGEIYPGVELKVISEVLYKC